MISCQRIAIAYKNGCRNGTPEGETRDSYPWSSDWSTRLRYWNEKAKGQTKDVSSAPDEVRANDLSIVRRSTCRSLKMGSKGRGRLSWLLFNIILMMCGAKRRFLWKSLLSSLINFCKNEASDIKLLALHYEVNYMPRPFIPSRLHLHSLLNQ